MLYSQLLRPSYDQVAERKGSYNLISERHVQAIWFEQKYFKGLKTAKDQVIEVLSAGIWNMEAGPDFLKAHIKIGDQEFRGDVEIHLHNEGWYQHQHHKDERYNSVILHLYFWENSLSTALLTKEGISIPSISIEPYLTVPAQRLLHLIDLDLYPYKKFLGSGKCSESLFKCLSNEKIKDFFISAAYWRLQEKKQHLSALFEMESLQFSAGLAMALGYKNNTIAFLELFKILLPFRTLPSDDLLAIAMGLTGFFDIHKKDYWLESEYFQKLHENWKANSSKITGRVRIKLDHIRPLNNPIRRIAYLINWIKHEEKDKVFEGLLKIWEERSRNSIKLRKALIEFIPDYQNEYWSHHYTFETDSQKGTLTLVGTDLRMAILINTFLPILSARLYESGTEQEKLDFQDLYSSFGASLSGKSRYLIHRFFGDTPKGKLLNNAQVQQGAFQLHKDFCRHFEASCEGCPFVERYNEVY